MPDNPLSATDHFWRLAVFCHNGKYNQSPRVSFVGMKYFKAQFAEFIAADGLKLPGILFEPRKKTKKVLIYLHGNGSSSVFYSMAKLSEQAKAINKAGVSYFAFNNRGAYQYHKVRRIRRGKEDKVMGGTAYELIKDCIKDIDGAIKFLETQGYSEFYLIGFSTGANKICVYNYYRPNNKVRGYILACGGDDVGIYYKMLGPKKFKMLLSKSKRRVKQHRGLELAGDDLPGLVYSYRGLYDIMYPDGNYNVFPYLEYFKKLKLSKKPLFRHFASIRKPALVVYGDRDEYSYRPIAKVINVLKDHCAAPERFQYQIISGADHGFTGKEREMNLVLANWLKSF